ncbi:MAG: transglycosylase SLT domain-containing protein [Kofleriaceae bacterium]
MRATLPLALAGVLATACSGDARRPAVIPDDSRVVAMPTLDLGGGDATSTPPTPAGPQPAPLSVEMADPAFPSGPAADAATRFALEDWAGARTGFAAARAAAGGDALLAARLDLMLAMCDAATRSWADAAREFAAARAGLPLLADWLGYQEARARYFAREADAALALARAVDPQSIAGADAELLVGDILRGRADATATADHYRGYLERRPTGIRRSEARFRLAEALEAVGGEAAQRELTATYRAILVADPLSSWATKAEARLTALAPSLPADARATIGSYSATELMTRAHELFDGMRNPESEAAFAAALAAPDLTAEQRCDAAYHRGQSMFKERDRRAAAPLFDAAIPLCKAVGNTDLEIKSNYQAGRSYAFHGDRKTAIARYQAAQVVDPSHSYSDDALLREAEEWMDLGDDAKLRATLGVLPERFPTGDNRAEAMWRMGYRAWKQDKVAEAIGWWEKQIAAVPIDDNYFGEGQAQYWIGRARARQGDQAAAIASYIEAIKLYPLSYYALLALNRLRESAPAAYQQVVAEINADPPGFDPTAPAFSFQPRVEWGTPGFARAMELLRLGLGDPAEAELRALGLVAPAGKSRVDDPDLVEKLWAMAYLYDRAGRYGTSHWPTRWHILDYRRAWPTGANRARWRIAYPRAFWPLLSEHAARNDVPVAMQIAIVREESAFDPLLESYANAIGLTQMIFPTAERFAKGTGITVSREALRDPEKNVTIGSRFLGYLFKYRKDFVLLVPPSYNAGEGGVNKWLRARGTQAADEFIESTAGDQARNYTKRVMSSYFTYSYLADGTIPTVPNKIPRDAWPK